jgi:uncharacterized membrane protein YozB (DUF420 family)
MSSLYNLPGFLGTRAHFLSDLTLVLIIISSTLFTIGWQLAVHKHYGIHRWVQTTAATINAIVVVGVMILSFLKFILPAIPGKLIEPSVWVTVIHAIIGLIGLLLGVFIVLRANKIIIPRRFWFNNYKLFMRTSYAIYMLATLIGVIVYITTFILPPLLPVD